MPISTRPSLRAITLLERKYQKNVLMTIEKIIRFRYTFMFSTNGEPKRNGTNRLTPRIKVVLKKAAPMMLPNAKLEWPRSIDLTPIVNSGRLVPIATIVAPIIC